MTDPMHNRTRISIEWEPRFDSRVAKGDGCWLWVGARDRDGYGQIKIAKRQTKAHHAAWIRAGRTIPDGMCVLHRCDNPPCVRIDHLFLGTLADNNADRAAKGRNNNQWHKISKTDHPRIRQRLAQGERVAHIAREYGVVISRIYAIKERG